MPQVTHKKSETTTVTSDGNGGTVHIVGLAEARNYTKFVFLGEANVTAATVQVSDGSGWFDYYEMGAGGPYILELQIGAAATGFSLPSPCKGGVRIAVTTGAANGVEFDCTLLASGSEYSESRRGR